MLETGFSARQHNIGLASICLVISTKICIYQALVQSVLLYAAETWTPLATDIKALELEAFHMKCQRQLLQISWQHFIRNDEFAATNGLPSISEVIRHRRSALFGHVARLPQDVPAHKALHYHVDLFLGRPPNDQWKRRPGRPRERWIMTRSGRTTAFPRRTCARRRATSRGHRGATR